MKSKLNVWGDSIAKGIIYDETRGRHAICRENCLARLAADGFQIENHSVMGQTSSDGLRRMLPEKIAAGDTVVIEYGGNDCDLDWKVVSAHPEVPQYGKVPIEQFELNLEEMVTRVRAAGARPVLVVPPPIVAERYFEFISRGLNADAILKYLGDVDHIARWQADFAGRVRHVAEKTGTALADLRAAFERFPDGKALMCADGIHPNSEGHEQMFLTARALLNGNV